MIRLCDLQQRAHRFKAESRTGMRDVENSGRFFGSDRRALAEEPVDSSRDRCGAGVADGNVGHEEASRALDSGLGQAVTSTSLGFVAAVELVGWLGATPVTVDTDSGIIATALQRFRLLIMVTIKAMRLVQPAGPSGDMNPMLRLASHCRLAMEQVHTVARFTASCAKPIGSFGDAIGLGLFFSTTFGRIGDGTANVNQAGWSGIIKRFCHHGVRRKFHQVFPGLDFRFEEIQVGMSHGEMPHPHPGNGRRRLQDSRSEALPGEWLHGIKPGARQRNRNHTVLFSTSTGCFSRFPVYDKFAIPVASRVADRRPSTAAAWGERVDDPTS